MRPFYLAATIASVVLAPSIAPAQDYPDRPTRMVVAFGAGGTLDTLARIVSLEAQ